nr:hypothetical protein CVNMHQAP_CVNMHQAP_CDS_0114 [uncultured phage]
MSYAKAKGTSYETAIVKYFTECGFTTARRIALSGAAGDKGETINNISQCIEICIERLG